jgi:hypothetical protein
LTGDGDDVCAHGAAAPLTWGFDRSIDRARVIATLTVRAWRRRVREDDRAAGDSL